MIRPGPDTPESDWEIARSSLERQPTRWGSLTWVSARPLIASLNHQLALHATGLVNGLRAYWSPDGPKIIEVPNGGMDQGSTTFFLIGDTGEQDASQYVVAPALSAATRDHPPEFVMIMSDVIYPSGDVNDYPDGVYRPYRSGDDNFRVDAPILGLAGNHDWYDGLAGFMFHFVGRDEPPDELYAPTAGDRSPLSRLCRILWRRASEPDDQTTAERKREPLNRSLPQPGPYFAIRTPDLLVVCIDTGIDATIDEEQAAWLRQVSRLDGPKILVTGKPLVVDEEIRACDVRSTDGATVTGDTVWELVNVPAHQYLATVGGDIHNFQQYRGIPGPGGPQLHLVAGGGGAFMHATHTLANAANDSRLRARPGRQFYGAAEKTFPNRGESLALFASLLVPTVRRVIGFLAVLLAGAAAAVLPALVADGGSGMPAGGRVPAILGAALLLVVLVVSALQPAGAMPRTSRRARARTVLIMIAVGLLAGGVGLLLDPEHLTRYAAFLVVAAALHAVADWLLRRAGWWRPADEFARNPSTLVFALGLVALAALVGLAQVVLGWWTAPRMALGSAILSASLIVVVGAYGHWRRRRRLTRQLPDGTSVDRRPELRRAGEEGRRELIELGAQNRAWHRAGLGVAQAVQAVCLLLGVGQLLVITGTVPSLIDGLFVIIGVLRGLVGATLILVLVVAGSLLGLTELAAALRRRRRQHPEMAWGAAARRTHVLIVPVLVAALATGLTVLTAIGGLVPAVVSTTARAATAPVTCLVLLIVALLVVDALRRRFRRGYLWLVLACAVLLIALGVTLAVSPATRWIVTYTAGAAVVLLAVGVVAVIGHLSFLGAFWVVVDRDPPSFTPAELEELFRARAAYPPRVPKVPANKRRWARLTSPALGEPGGFLQREVSEIFSSDEPPFYKGFLRMTTSRTKDGDGVLRIVLHRVYGDRRSEEEEIATIGFTPVDRPADHPIDHPAPGVRSAERPIEHPVDQPVA